MKSNKLEWGNSIKAFICGCINAALVIPVFISFATIIFRDPFFQDFMPYLVKLVCASCIVHQITFTCFSSLPFSIGQVQDAGLIFLSSMASSIVKELWKSGKVENPLDIIATSLVVLSIATVCLGLAVYFTGKFRLANVVQYLPMPIIGGYLAYIGFFCLQAGLSLMTNVEVHSLKEWIGFVTYDCLLKIAPGIFSGVCLYLVATRYSSKPFILPLVLFVIPVIFYMVMFVTETSLDEARKSGWIANSAKETPTIVEIYKLYSFPRVHWSVLLQQVPTWCGMYIVVAFSSCLDVAAIEINLRSSLNYNHELKTVGLSNIFSGLTGGFTGSYIFSQTIFTMKSNTNSRIPGITVIFSEILVLLLPIALTCYIPKFFFGGLLVFISIDLCMEWMMHSYHKLKITEYLLVWVTFIFIVFFGLEIGLSGGIVCAIFHFLFNYANAIEIYKKIPQSAVQRNFLDRKKLLEFQDEIICLEVHGYLFFGSGIQVMEKVKEHIHKGLPSDKSSALSESTPLLDVSTQKKISNSQLPFGKLKKTEKSKCNVFMLLPKENTAPPLSTKELFLKKVKYLLLDFQYVSGVDATAALSCFNGIRNYTHQNDIFLVFTSLNPDIESQLKLNGVIDPSDPKTLVLRTMDKGLEWCEDNILQRQHIPGNNRISLFSPHVGSSTSYSLTTTTPIETAPPVVAPLPLENQVGHHHKEDLLETLALGLHLSPSDHRLQELACYFTETTLLQDEHLFTVGDLTNELYILQSGEVEFLVNGTTRLLKLGPGSIVGDIDFSLERRRSYSCTAVTNCVLFKLALPTFHQMCEENPACCVLLQKLLMKCMSLSVSKIR